jgi:hypothetical protein
VEGTAEAPGVHGGLSRRSPRRRAARGGGDGGGSRLWEERRRGVPEVAVPPRPGQVGREEAYSSYLAKASAMPPRPRTSGVAGASALACHLGVGRGQRGEERRLRRSRPARGGAAAVTLDMTIEGMSGGDDFWVSATISCKYVLSR